jgi:hypothetical protein
MKYIVVTTCLILALLLSGCYKVQPLDESDRYSVIAQIIKEERITCICNEFKEPDDSDSILYFLATQPDQLQKANRGKDIIRFSKLFDKEDINGFRKQMESRDSTLRLSAHLHVPGVRFVESSDTTAHCDCWHSVSYPLMNKNKTALVVFYDYYCGMLSGGKMAFVYIKRGGAWVRLVTIWTFIS